MPTAATNSAQLTFRHSRIVPASQYQVAAVLNCPEDAEQWMDGRTKIEVLDRSHTYMRQLGYPLLRIKDRDVIVERHLERLNDGTLRCWGNGVKDDRKRPLPDCVRLPAFESSFVMRPLGTDLTEVTYRMAVNLGGGIPTWLRRFAGGKMAAQTLERVARQAQRIGMNDDARHLRGLFEPAEKPRENGNSTKSSCGNEGTHF